MSGQDQVRPEVLKCSESYRPRNEECKKEKKKKKKNTEENLALNKAAGWEKNTEQWKG